MAGAGVAPAGAAAGISGFSTSVSGPEDVIRPLPFSSRFGHLLFIARWTKTPCPPNKPNGRSILRRSLVLLAPLAAAFCRGAALAQAIPPDAPAVQAGTPASKTKPAMTKKSHSVSGSPLDTLRSTHLWTSVGPAKDFVTTSRPDAKTLDYAPLTGADPERPKPRDAANVQALQAELEHDRGVNEGRGRAVGGQARRARQAAKAAPRPATTPPE